MIKSPHTQRQHGSVGRTVGRFPLLTGGWSRAVLNVVLVLLAATTVLADDKQTADGQTKSASDQSTRLQRILDNELPRDVDDLKVMEKHIQGLAKKALDVTVAVIIRNTQGSGVIVSEDGYVLTAAHVAGRPNRRVLIVLPDGRTTQGYTLGAFRSVDAGLIKIGRPDGEDDSNVKWPFVEMGDSKKAALGQWCLATGHPGGYQLDRKPVVRVGRLVHKYKDVLTTDCTLISGDSGGPLFNMEGKVIGVHSRIGFELRHNVHVPVHHYQENWERLLEGEVWGKMPEAPFLGVHGRNDIPKTRISMVDKDGPADKAGIQVGDDWYNILIV